MRNTYPEKIKIFGAGISGLVAAIDLAMAGFDVEVIEKRDAVGGPPEWHPSVHQQSFDLEKTAQYVNIDIASCFRPVRQHTFLFYNNKIIIDKPLNSYICEKGPQSTSIEHHLYKLASETNVHFSFGESFDIRKFLPSNNNCIIATGLEPKPYQDLDIRHSAIHGFRASAPLNGDPFIKSYMGNYTGHEFAYVASSGDLIFALLFSRKGIGNIDLQAFSNHLLESDNLVFDNWKCSAGCIPLEKNLVKNGVVLAGTISGMIDPYYLNGISAALISGKIAALYFTDREKAFRDFNRFTRNFFIKQKLQSLSYHLPAKPYSFPLVSFLNSKFKWVGVI